MRSNGAFDVIRDTRKTIKIEKQREKCTCNLPSTNISRLACAFPMLIDCKNLAVSTIVSTEA